MLLHNYTGIQICYKLRHPVAKLDLQSWNNLIDRVYRYLSHTSCDWGGVWGDKAIIFLRSLNRCRQIRPVQRSYDLPKENLWYFSGIQFRWCLLFMKRTIILYHVLFLLVSINNNTSVIFNIINVNLYYLCHSHWCYTVRIFLWRQKN